MKVIELLRRARDEGRVIVEERAMDSSCACAPVRNPPPGFFADAKLSTPILRSGDGDVAADDVRTARLRAPSSVDALMIDNSPRGGSPTRWGDVVKDHAESIDSGA